MILGWLLDDIKRDRPGGGGGGRPHIRLGRVGPRGRMYANAKPSGGRSTCVVKSKFVSVGQGSGRHIVAHLRYIEERERGERERERDFFDRGRDGIERKEVERAMLGNRGERVAMHKLILSPGDNDVNVRDYTRDSMEALEERLGHRLDWYGVIHANTDHHHAHVVIAGKIPDRQREHERTEAREEAQWLDRLLDKLEAEDRYIARALRGEEIDPRDRDVVPEREYSVDEVKTNKFLDKYEREMMARERAQERGDVHLDRNDLKELRSAGNDYVHRDRSLDRAWERAYEREFGRELELERTRERELSLERSPWSDISRHFEADREQGEIDRGYERDRDDDEERRREREYDRGDDFGR
ncbi:MAG TPA: hypothetical protein PK671_04290 [Candidatus Obscuribacter sp.]|nr:hypothetical protein [Candidatus Obscuribacter sp.]HMY52143.1 hypothetical protein [Candidatus Obscuribacter sp.]HND05916.1 hypothetical protein [Candidatus Obscuribacter sp.]